ncbi:MAG: hypothetical protein ACM31D_11085 [Bacteroidota bacterium]
MSGKRSRPGLLSRLAAPIAKAARRVARRQPDENDEVRKLMEAALAEASTAPARLTDDAFRMFTEQLAQQEDGAFQVKLHVISLVEFREAVGDKWFKLADKVMMIAEGVINMHLGAGNVFNRQGSDFFVLVFRTCDDIEGRRRALVIAQELGTRLVGDQFIGSEVPLALAAELSAVDGLNPDGSINLSAVHAAVGEMRALIAAQAPQAAPPPAWMRGGAIAKEPQGPRRHLMAGAPPPKPAADTRPPIAVAPEAPAKAAPQDPGWKKLKVEKSEAAQQPTWVILDAGATRPLPPTLETLPDTGAQPLPADAKLSLVWRPSWIAAGEVIGAYEARIQRVDTPGAAPLEGTHAYARDDEPGANTLDRFRIAGAIRELRASEAAGNGATVVIPVHWLTITSENRMEFLAPFADVTQAARGNRIVIELFGVPTDVKPIVLGAVVARTRELCREVALRTRIGDPRAAMALDCGATLIGIDVAELAGAERTDDDHLLEALQDFQAQAAKARLGSYVWGVRRRKVIVGAVQMGFGMVNGPALMKDIAKPAKVLPAPKSRFTLT